MTPSDLPTDPASLRSDLLAIANLISAESSVLDLGCDDGSLLWYLKHQKQVKGRGIELSEAGVLTCVRRGLSVRQGNLQEGLADYPDNSFDYIVLAQTLRYLDDPAMILSEMLRVGRWAIVSFANWGYWRNRLHFLTTGRVPDAPEQPQPWHQPPRWQAFTLADFIDFCHLNSFLIRKQVYLAGERPRHTLPNLLAHTAIFVLENGN